MPDLKHVLTPMFNVDDVQQAIDVWTTELDFKIDGIVRDQETGGVHLAELSLDGLPIMISPMQDESPLGAGGISFYVYLNSRSIDDYFEQVAAQSGVTVCMAVEDQWWGDRIFTIQDSLGYYWTFARSGAEINPPDGMAWETGDLVAGGVDILARPV